MDRLAFLKRLAVGLFAAPVLAEVVKDAGSPEHFDFPAAPGIDIPSVRYNIHETLNPRWKPHRLPSETELHEDVKKWFASLERT